MNDWLGLMDTKVMIVGAGGFGNAIVGSFVNAGAHVYAVDRDKARLHDLEQEHGAAVATSMVDIATRKSCEGAVEDALGALGRIDVLVHVAGVNNRVEIDEITDEDWHEILTINTTSCLWMGRAVGRHMRDRGSGSIVFFSSVSGLLAHPHHGAYAASKGALDQLLKVMAVEWAPAGVRVNGVAPGYAVTPLTADYVASPGHTERLLQRIPMGRFGVASDVVGPVLLFASPRSAYVTGQVLYVDGGRILD